MGSLPGLRRRDGDETADGRSGAALDDTDEAVAVEIPGLLAEARVGGLEDALVQLAERGPRYQAASAAKHVLVTGTGTVAAASGSHVDGCGPAG